MCVLTDGTERPVPIPAKLLSDNSISLVWRAGDGWIYKRSIPYLIETELAMLTTMRGVYVPGVARYDKYTLAIQDAGESEPITNTNIFVANCEHFLTVMNMRGVRHGDLTSPHVIVRNNSPIVIDWAESRVFTDPAPDKREEGDSYWMHKTMRGMIG
jgi:RIO-like serine/threonine protein kinase